MKPSPSEVKRLREKLGLTQEAFAERLGVSFSTVNRWENGHTRPTRLAIFRLQRMLDEANIEASSPAVSASDEHYLRPVERVVAALRDRLIIFDPANPERCFENRNVLKISHELGPVRSVVPDLMYGKPVLLVGTRDGVIIVSPSDSPRIIRFSFGELSSQGLGTNSAKIHQGCLYATHSEHGLFRWRLDHPTSAKRLFRELLRGTKTVRCLTALDRERLLFLADNRLFSFSKTSTNPDLIYESPEGQRLTSVRLFEHKVFIAAADSRIESFDLVFQHSQSLVSYERTHLYSADIVQFMDAPYLVLGTKRPCVQMVGLEEDSDRITYSSGSVNLRFATATNAHVIATDYGQNSILIWKAEQPERPVARVPVAQMTKHHVQDLTVLKSMDGAVK